jgi:DNA-binding IclR family transcriptional regulator
MTRQLRPLDRSFISSLSHGLSVLETVADCEHDIGLADLAEKVGFNKTNTWRLAHTLVELGYLDQDPHTRNFRPAARTLALGYAYFDGLDLRQLALPFLRELSSRHNETVNFAVRSGDQLIYIDRLNSSHIIAVNLHIGSRLPLYCTSLGRALICEMPESWIEQYTQRVVKDSRTQKDAPGKLKRLRQCLAETRERGYATNNEELVKGLRAVSSPIRDGTTAIVAVVGIAVPSSRATVSDLERIFAPGVVEAAEKISLALGYRADKPGREPHNHRFTSNGGNAATRRAR